MTFGQVIEENKINVFLQIHAGNKPGKLVPELILSFKKALYEVKASGIELSFNIFR